VLLQFVKNLLLEIEILLGEVFVVKDGVLVVVVVIVDVDGLGIVSVRRFLFGVLGIREIVL